MKVPENFTLETPEYCETKTYHCDSVFFHSPNEDITFYAYMPFLPRDEEEYKAEIQKQDNEATI